MNESTISIEGKGAIHVVPDVTRLEVTISGHFDSYAAAYAQGKENSSWMVKILEYNKKPGKLAKTIKFEVSEHTKPKHDKFGHVEEWLLDGYDLRQIIKIDLPMNNVLVNNIIRGIGKFITGAEASVNYTLQDMRPSQLKMLERAVTDARDKAEKMAKALGCSLGKVISVRYGHGDIHVMSQARYIHSNAEAKASTADSLAITPDDLVMSDTADVVFELVNPE